MRRTRSVARLGACALATAGALALGPRVATADATSELATLFRDYWEHQTERDPLGASYRGDHRFSDRLQDLSAEARAEHCAALEGFRSRIASIDRESLTREDRLSAEIFERLVEQNVEALALDPHLTRLNQLWGPQLELPQVPNYHPFDTAEHARAYATRLEAFSTQVDQMIANLREGMRRGVVQYRGTIEKCVPQLRGLAEGPAAEHALGEAVEKLSDEIPAEERERIAAEILAAVEEHALPAYARLADFVESDYLPACRAQPGLHALPGGADRYASRVRRFTTTDLSAQEIHDLGVAEIERIRGEMEDIRKRVEFDGTLIELFEHLRTDERFYTTSKEEYLAGYREILAAMDAKLPRLFGRLPATPYELKEMESWREKSAPAAYYYHAPDDGSRPGYFYVNTYDLASRPTYSMEALAYHEAVPGHHLQIALQQELDLPNFRRHSGFTVFTEGWGLYSERIPLEVGAYADPYSDFGRLVFEAWRACRLVVDTGIHALGWDRDRAIAYCEANTALSRHEIEVEVDRYVAVPGQALAYKIGEIRIRELRADAERRLGARFDVRAFHDAVLKNGPVPLDVLEAVVDRWVEEVAASPLDGDPGLG